MHGCPPPEVQARQRPFRALGVLAAAAVTACGVAQQDDVRKAIEITGDRLGGFVLPIEPIQSNIILNAQQVWTWKVDDTLRLQLDGDVQVDVGGYAFSSDEAFVWIDRIPSSDGLVNQIAIYFPSVEEPTRRAGLGVTGDNVLVLGTARGSVRLAASVHNEQPPPLSMTLREGEQRLSLYLRRLLATQPRLATRPMALQKTKPELPTPVPGASPRLPDEEARELANLPRTITLPTEPAGSLPIFQPEGLVSFTANRIDIDESTDTIVADGFFLVDYDPMGSNDDFSPLQLNAGGGVIFLADGATEKMRGGQRQVSVEDVLGIYLEGNVTATDGRYTIRSRAIYYDLHTNRALMIDSLLRTYTRLTGEKPIYSRAKEMRQLSSTEWDARKATISTSSFFKPQLALGLERVTISKRPVLSPDGTSGGETITWIEGEDLTVRAGGVPFFYLPSFSGEADAIPFRSIKLGYDDEYGAAIETEWDIFSMLGIEAPDGMEGELLVDGFTKRGPGGGVDLRTSAKGYSGSFRAYGLYDTGGTDRTSAGISKQIAESFRGEIEGNFVMALSSDMTFRADLSWLSDPTFASAWRRDEFNTRTEYRTGASFDYRIDNTELALAINYSLIPFVANNYMMASRPYYVDKAPELTYRRYADSLFEDSISWTSEYSATYMRLNVTNGTANTLGVPNDAFATNRSNQRVASLYYGQAGYNNDFVTRVDTRHEFSMPLDYGPTNVVPYMSGRFTGYVAERFGSYNPEAQHYRMFGSFGVKANTTFMEVHNNVRSELFDIDRIRHIMKPYIHGWAGVDTLDDTGLPVYDQEVEAISPGTAIQLGLRQTLQTKRGGAGRRQSVDWLDLDVGTVINDGANVFTLADARTPWNYAQSPTPSWVDWRPELSQWGSHFYGRLNWQLSDTFSIGGSTTYLIDQTTGVALNENGTLRRETYSGLMRGSIGFEVQHTPSMSTYLEYRYLKVGISELLQGGVAYQFGRRYVVGVTPQYDIANSELRAITARLTRTFNDFDLSFQGGYDVVRDSPSISVRFALPPGSAE